MKLEFTLLKQNVVTVCGDVKALFHAFYKRAVSFLCAYLETA
jgi:hypothetical protein